MAVPALAPGLTAREATVADHPGIIALCGEVFGTHEAAAVRHLLTAAGYGPGRWTVVTDPDGEVVSCCTLLGHRLRYGGTDVPAGQIEYVATRARFRRRGLVRAQFDLHHRWAAEAGALVLFITGIPYLYRRLGYGYGIEYATEYHLARRPTGPEGWTVDGATPADLPALRRLQDRAQDRAHVALHWPDSGWAWLLEGAPSWDEEVLVARRDGAVGGFTRIQRRPTENYAQAQGAADGLAPARALVAHAAAVADPLPLYLLDRPGDPWGTVVRSAGTTDPARFNAVYVRIPDPGAFLHHVRDELSSRLEASPLAAESGALALSFFEDGVVVHYERGVVTAVRRDPDPALDPMDDDRPGVAPDALPALLLGRFSAAELELRFDDVGYAADRDLVATLFPRLSADVSAPI